MTSRLLNEAELFFTVTLRRLNLSSSGGRSYLNLAGRERGSESVGQITADRRADTSGHLSLYSGLWSRFFTAVFFLVALFLSGSSRSET